MNSINLIKLKETLGSIQVRLNKVDEKLSSLDDVKQEVSQIKNSFAFARELLTLEQDSNKTKITTRFPKGGKSL